MTTKFSLHKIWFFYTDEWYMPRGLAGSVGTFESLEEAENAKKILERNALKNMQSDDYFRDLTYFYEKNYSETQNKIIEYAKSQNWNDSLIEKSDFFDKEKKYWEFILPQDASDSQIDKILELTDASFHQIIEYKNVKEYAYLKVNYDFWGKKVFDKLKSIGILDSRSPYISGISSKGYYLLSKPPKGRKSAKFPAINDAIVLSSKVFLDSILEFPENNFLGKTYLEDWSDAPQLLIAYLNNCKTIHLTSTEITKENLKSYSTKLKKLKASITLKEGMNYYDVSFAPNETIDTNELSGFFEFLKLKPFNLFNMISEINGRQVTDYELESGTF